MSDVVCDPQQKFSLKGINFTLFPGTMWMEAATFSLQKIQTSLFSQMQPDVHDLSQLSCSLYKTTHFCRSLWACFNAFQPNTFQSEAFNCNVQGSLILQVNKGAGVVLYLTWRVETTLKGPVAVPELFPLGLTGLFKTRQLQCGLDRKTGRVCIISHNHYYIELLSRPEFNLKFNLTV